MVQRQSSCSRVHIGCAWGKADGDSTSHISNIGKWLRGINSILPDCTADGVFEIRPLCRISAGGVSNHCIH